MESQHQNPEISNNPENSHPLCQHGPLYGAFAQMY